MADLTLHEAERIVEEDERRQQAHRDIEQLRHEAQLDGIRVQAQRRLDRLLPEFDHVRRRYANQATEAQTAFQTMTDAFDDLVRVCQTWNDLSDDLTRYADQVATAQRSIDFPEGVPPEHAARYDGAAVQFLQDNDCWPSCVLKPESREAQLLANVVGRFVKINVTRPPAETPKVNIVLKDGSSVWSG